MINLKCFVVMLVSVLSIIGCAPLQSSRDLNDYSDDGNCPDIAGRYYIAGQLVRTDGVKKELLSANFIYRFRGGGEKYEGIFSAAKSNNIENGYVEVYDVGGKIYNVRIHDFRGSIVGEYSKNLGRNYICHQGAFYNQGGISSGKIVADGFFSKNYSVSQYELFVDSEGRLHIKVQSIARIGAFGGLSASGSRIMGDEAIFNQYK